MIDKIYVSVLKEYIEKTRRLIKRYQLDKVVSIIPGGETAQDTIYQLLKEIERENDEDSIVLIHDGVRPFVSYDTIKKNIESIIYNDAACYMVYGAYMLQDYNNLEDVIAPKEIKRRNIQDSGYDFRPVAVRDL